MNHRSPVAPRPTYPPALKAELVALANAIGDDLTGDFAQVRALVDAHLVVFAVWQDRVEPAGIGMMIVKGQQHLREIVASQHAVQTSYIAIPCASAEQAEALRQVAGEPNARH